MKRGEITIYQDGSWGLSVSGSKEDRIVETVQELIETNQAAWEKPDKR